MGNTTALLFALCVILICLPPRFDPAIRIKEWFERKLTLHQDGVVPHCYRSNPGPQTQAENCCSDCPVRKSCPDKSEIISVLKEPTRGR